MPVKRRQSKRLEPVPEWAYQYYETGEYLGTDDPVAHFSLHSTILRYNDRRHRPDDVRPKYWDDISAELTEDYVREHPGSRPWGWWVLDAPAPELVEQDDDHRPREVMRRQVGGSGALSQSPRFNFGIPGYIDDFDPPLPGDPPVCESQAMYLKRYGLLDATEKRKLRKKDYEPEVIEMDPDELAEAWEFLEWEKAEKGKATTT